ncbi:MAG TPA: porin [Acidovorax sp.]|nr:porin [Acidovorax sp.]
MKKSLIALAVLAASGAAMAQSSVTLFGVVDAAYTYGSGSVANRSGLTSGNNSTSRLGFRGVEDLGGGLAASFWLEAQLNADNGTGGVTNTNNQAATSTGGGLTFNRRSTVSLNGGFGEVRLGRDYTPQFWNLTVFDPFGTVGVGTTQTLNSSLGGPTTVRASNSIGYFLPGNLGGFYGQAQYYMGENLSNAANKKDGNGLALRAGYANGPINAAIAFSETKFLTGNIKAFNLGGQYDLGMAKIMAQYNQDKISGGNDGKGFLIGGLVPVGAGEVRLSYSTYKIDTIGVNTPDPRTNKLALGYVHNLSKRTALYATYAHLTNKNGAAQALGGAVTGANSNSNGYDFGLRHSF